MSEPQEARVSVHGNLTTKQIVMMERRDLAHHYYRRGEYGAPLLKGWEVRMVRRAADRLRDVAVCARLAEVWP